jgi:hypothetical protein
VAEKRSKPVKVSAILDVELHAKLSACAALRGTTKNAILVAALTEALKGIVAFDRAKPTRRSGSKDRVVPEDNVNPDDEIAA